jgi:hypothetical protein
LLNQIEALFNPAHGSITALLPEGIVTEKSNDVSRKSTGVALWREQSSLAIAYDLRDSSMPTTHDRKASGLCFGEYHSECFSVSI